MSIADKLLERGIHLRSYEPGNRYTLCPECSHTRKGHNRKKPVLSVAIGPTTLKNGGSVERDCAVYHCIHCNWTGGIGDRTTGNHTGYRGRSEGKGAGPRNGVGQRDADPRRKRWW